MTQSELAEKSGFCDKSAICEIETQNKLNGAVNKILALCKALDVSPNELLGWEEPKKNVFKVKIRLHKNVS